MKIKFVRKSAKTLDTRAARLSQLTANSKYLFHIQNISSQKGGRNELGFDGRNLVYRPLRVLTKVKTHINHWEKHLIACKTNFLQRNSQQALEKIKLPRPRTGS